MTVTEDPDALPEAEGAAAASGVALLVHHEANARLLAGWLADHERFDLVAEAPAGLDDGVDLCVVDEAGLAAGRDAIAAWKGDSEAVFAPCLLVSEAGASAVDDDEALVDDVVALPAPKVVLGRRLGQLLRRREQSLALEEDRRYLREQNERLRMFAARLAHDLRNPLGIALGYLEEARDTGESDHFDAVRAALARMRRLVDETLMLAKMGETAIERQPVGLRAVAERAWAQVDTGDATLSVAGDGRLEADESRLQELFENLFRNAVEHIGDDVAVRVGVLADADGFFVADDGPGISEHDREQVFEVGYTTRSGGTGFGLRIVQEICEAHGWSVRVTAADGGGARFEVTDVALGGPADDVGPDGPAE